MRIGVDLGGTKIEVIALDDHGQILDKSRVDTPSHSYHQIVQTIHDLVCATETRLGTLGTVGVGIPGTISQESCLVKNANTVVLIGQPFDQDLARALARPVKIANDANCFTLSEAQDGAASGSHVAFGVIIGTGCGGGIVVDGKIIEGINSIAGEWGHNRLADMTDEERPGPKCYCGHQGCIETFISGPGMVQDHLRVTGEKLTTREICGGARVGHQGAVATVQRYADRLARSLAVVINILDPDTIVLGGGMSNIDELYEMVPKIWGRYIFSDSVNTQLKKAMHGDSSGVRGAARLWPIP